jgi:hypothetical protein
MALSIYIFLACPIKFLALDSFFFFFFAYTHNKFLKYSSLAPLLAPFQMLSLSLSSLDFELSLSRFSPPSFSSLLFFLSSSSYEFVIFLEGFVLVFDYLFLVDFIFSAHNSFAKSNFIVLFL